MSEVFIDCRRILVIEDEPVTRELVHEMLKSIPDCRVYLAPSLEEAEAVLRERIVDLIVLDLRLPEKDGFEFLKERRTNRARIRRKVLVLSGLTDSESVRRAALLGADDFAVKPVDRDSFLLKVRGLLEGSR